MNSPAPPPDRRIIEAAAKAPFYENLLEHIFNNDPLPLGQNLERRRCRAPSRPGLYRMASGGSGSLSAGAVARSNAGDVMGKVGSSFTTTIKKKKLHPKA